MISSSSLACSTKAACASTSAKAVGISHNPTKEKIVPNTRTNEMLGYPPDARLLILNADDFGMYHAVNQAIFHTLKEGVVRSTTLMAPCPGRGMRCNCSGIIPILPSAFT